MTGCDAGQYGAFPPRVPGPGGDAADDLDAGRRTQADLLNSTTVYVLAVI